MRQLFRQSLLLLTVVAAGSAFGQQPPDVVTSDAYQNTAMGTDALLNVTPSGGYGAGNTASGSQALEHNTTGYDNTAAGGYALGSNTTGSANSALGVNALGQNSTGSWNVASGFGALNSNTTGSGNTAAGADSLVYNKTGSDNTACGSTALYANATGAQNTAIGTGALFANRAGGNNIAVGYNAGASINGGYRNIDIGNVGASRDAGVIRIGNAAQHNSTFVAGINNAHLTGSAVYISSTGQLGVLASSERYKTAITPMGESTRKLNRLRPVTFHLKTDPRGVVQYGLIAEEVGNVYPELVIRDGTGKVQGVRYEELAPMLLNEMQAQSAEIRELKEQLQRLNKALIKVQPRGEVVAQR